MSLKARNASPKTILTKATRFLEKTLTLVSQVEDEDDLLSLVRDLRRIKWRMEDVQRKLFFSRTR
jgi:hypothetical protein